MSISIEKLIQRFHDNYIPEPNSGCWIWTASVDKDGYGRMMLLGEVKAHRASLKYHKGLGDNTLVCHKCDNPSCVNPDHLYEGSAQSNMDDKTIRHRNNPAYGTRSGTAKLTRELVEEIKLATGRYKDLAGEFGVSPAQICRIKTGTRWNHNYG